MEFLELLDQLHKDVAIKHKVAPTDRDFRSYHTIDFGKVSSKGRFTIQKKLIKSKLLIVDGKQRVYLSDSQIIETILEMPSDNIAWFLDQMVNLYNGNGSSFTFTINKQSFDFVGIPYFHQEQVVLLPSDTTVDINEFISIINCK